MVAAPAWGAPTLVPHESYNLQLIAPDAGTPDAGAPGALDLAPQTRGAAHNWFAALFSDLPPGIPLDLRIHMAGQNTANPADVAKWQGLQPVYSYADPDKLETYRVFRREANGQWHTVLDPLHLGRASEAGNGALPRQSAIEDGYAPLFLSADKRTWTAWREIAATEVDRAANVFAFRQTFALPRATVAMRVPFTNAFFDAFCAQLRAADPLGVSVDEVGTTPAGHTLRAIRVEDAADTVRLDERPTIAVFAREHATEHDGSWAVYGLLAHLMQDSPQSRQLRAAATWILVPLQDPDGAALSRFERMTERFQRPHDPDIPPEVFAWTRYFADWADSGRTLDLAVSLHNVESDEAPNLSSPFVNQAHSALIENLNLELFERVSAAGFAVGSAQGIAAGASPFRLYGWCARQLGALDLAYEVNGRFPGRRLDQAQLGEVGVALGDGLARWLWSEAGRDWHAQSALWAQMRLDKRAAYLAEKGEMAPPNTERARYELLELGF